MTPETAARLLALNRQFYDSLAESFAASRARPQPGYEKLLAYLPSRPLRVLDVGCGNGRFGAFLAGYHPIAAYTGVDFSAGLLARAKGPQVTEPQTTDPLPVKFVQRDISKPGFLEELGRFDVVACLAVMQHIPGRANRQRLLAEMAAHLDENGRLFLANWQFMDSKRQRRKVVEWQRIGLTPADVEPNDYLLTWQRDGFGLRYVCVVDEEETAVLARSAGLKIIARFRSDGKEGNLSLYTVLAATNQSSPDHR